VNPPRPRAPTTTSCARLLALMSAALVCWRRTLRCATTSGYVSCKPASAAVLFSSHQLDVVEHLCEDVVVIDSRHVVLTGELDKIRDAAPDRYVEVTVTGDPERVLHSTEAIVVAKDGDRVRLRVPRTVDPVALLAGLGGGIVRMAYEPPTLSEPFRAAVAGETVSVREVSGVAG
jgi:ABC-type uncharacterized transport system ATPase subunit